jgi:hypothetical protein
LGQGRLQFLEFQFPGLELAWFLVGWEFEQEGQPQIVIAILLIL